eukprot:scaffold35169_cov77-Phaeocystis_antarctica.AAC.1
MPHGPPRRSGPRGTRSSSARAGCGLRSAARGRHSRSRQTRSRPCAASPTRVAGEGSKPARKRGRQGGKEAQNLAVLCSAGEGASHEACM